MGRPAGYVTPDVYRLPIPGALGAIVTPVRGGQPRILAALARLAAYMLIVMLTGGCWWLSPEPTSDDVEGAADWAAPTVTLETPIVLGAMKHPVIEAVIRGHLKEITSCYEQGFAARPDLAGRVSVSFTISSAGSVSKATVRRSTLGETAVEACVASVFSEMVFPQPVGGGIVIVLCSLVFD